MRETCYHCGEPVIGKPITTDNHSFCCSGCKSVYLVLKSSDLDSFYSIENQAGNRPGSKSKEQYRFLDTISWEKCGECQFCIRERPPNLVSCFLTSRDIHLPSEVRKFPYRQRNFET